MGTAFLTLLGLYVSFGIIHSIIVAPAPRFKEKYSGTSFVTSTDLFSMYQANKPSILRRIKILDFCIMWHWVFYVAAILLLLITAWPKTSLLKWILLFVAAIPVYMILQHLITLLGFTVDAIKQRKANWG